MTHGCTHADTRIGGIVEHLLEIMADNQVTIAEFEAILCALTVRIGEQLVASSADDDT